MIRQIYLGELFCRLLAMTCWCQILNVLREQDVNPLAMLFFSRYLADLWMNFMAFFVNVLFLIMYCHVNWFYLWISVHILFIKSYLLCKKIRNWISVIEIQVSYSNHCPFQRAGQPFWHKDNYLLPKPCFSQWRISNS